jgi:hypothetical protein
MEGKIIVTLYHPAYHTSWEIGSLPQGGFYGTNNGFARTQPKKYRTFSSWTDAQSFIEWMKDNGWKINIDRRGVIPQ